MTRRDYKLITAALEVAYLDAARDDELFDDNMSRNMVLSIAHTIAYALAEDNKAFDKDLFIKNVKGEQ